MADKRQFSMQIIDSDDFLEMPLSAQALYLHLSMRADDDGFVPNASRIMKLVDENKSDYDPLVAKAYVIEFDDGICVVGNPYVQQYLKSGPASKREVSAKEKTAEVKKYDWLVQAWNELQQYGVTPIRGISDSGERIRQVRARVKQYGKDGILEAIKNISESGFLTGNNNRGWVITFDWLFKPSNFQKVIDGNYNKRKPAKIPNQKPEEEEEYINLWDNE